MGGQQSKTVSTSEVVAQSFVNVAQRVSNHCGNTATALNEIKNLHANGSVAIGGVNMNNMVNINFSCINSSQNKSDFISQLQSQIQKDLTSSTSGVGGAYSSAEVQSGIKTVVSSCASINLDDVQKCFTSNASTNSVSDIQAGQNIVISSLDMNNAISLTSKCINSSSALQQAMNSLDNAQKETSSTSVTGLDLLAPYETLIIACAGVCALCSITCIVSSALAAFRRNNNSNNVGGISDANIANITDSSLSSSSSSAPSAPATAASFPIEPPAYASMLQHLPDKY